MEKRWGIIATAVLHEDGSEQGVASERLSALLSTEAHLLNVSPLIKVSLVTKAVSIDPGSWLSTTWHKGAVLRDHAEDTRWITAGRRLDEEAPIELSSTAFHWLALVQRHSSAMASSNSKTPEHLHIEKLVKTKLPSSPIYQTLLSPVRIVSASNGIVIARLPLSDVHMNSAGSLHGSVSATIVDWVGGMAIATVDLRDKTGASIDIHVTYQSGAKVGDEIEIEGIAERVGVNLAFTKIGIYRVESEQRGRVIATGTHTKFVKGSEPKALP
nr:acyl-coenzyme a thioesterase 13 [Quercus suber]